jgi:hypothetical protein
LRCPARVSNHLAHGLLPSFETPREARAAPQDEVGIHSQALRMTTVQPQISKNREIDFENVAGCSAA